MENLLWSVSLTLKLVWFHLRTVSFELLVSLIYRMMSLLLMPVKKPWYITRQALNNFPANSLGEKFSAHLDSVSRMPIKRLEYLELLRFLLQQPKIAINEIKLQFWWLGNGGRNLESILIAVIGYIWFPENGKIFKEAYQVGGQFERIGPIDYQKLLKKPYSELQMSLH